MHFPIRLLVNVRHWSFMSCARAVEMWLSSAAERAVLGASISSQEILQEILCAAFLAESNVARDLQGDRRGHSHG